MRLVWGRGGGRKEGGRPSGCSGQAAWDVQPEKGGRNPGGRGHMPESWRLTVSAWRSPRKSGRREREEVKMESHHPSR